MSRKSEVWNYFSKINGDKARCSYCGRILACKGGNTTGMSNHLSTHALILRKSSCERQNLPLESVEQVKNTENCSNKKPNILGFLRKETLGSILSKYAAVDGFSLNAIKNSSGIKEHLQLKNFKMPHSNSTLTKYILQYYDQRKLIIVHELEKLKENGTRFSISIDEWCDAANRRFLNITIHGPGRDFVLGLFPMVGSFTSEDTVRLVDSALKSFKVELKNDIVASINDGAAVMVKYGRLIDALCQLCYNHAIHLAVIKTFYCKKLEFMKNSEEKCSSQEEYSDEEDPYASNFFVGSEENTELITPKCSINDILALTRKTVKYFRNSPTRMAVLDKYVLEQEKNKLNLLLDCKTRWNTLLPMIDRFAKLEKPINLSLKELGIPIIEDNHFKELRSLHSILNPVYIVVLELGKSNANLLTAEGSLIFILNKLKSEKNESGIEFYNNLKEEMLKRRNKKLVSLLYYLQNGSLPASNDDLRYSEINEVVEFAEKIFDRLFPNYVSQIVDLHEKTVGTFEEKIFSDKDKLKISIDTVMKAVKCDYNNQLKMDLSNLALLGAKRSDRLEKLFSALLTIKPTSIASERVFSTASLKMTKIRNKMSVSLLNALVFLKYDFSTNH